jgi:type IV fimbrial biogenesis protein FimT
MPVRRHPPRGFTLVECLIALAVAIVLLGSAVPAFTRQATARALGAQAGQFMSALRFARSEAIKRGAVVTVCARDPAAAQARCLEGTGADWRAGWIVYADPGGRGQLDAGETVLRVQSPLSPSGGIAGTRSRVSFTAGGFSTDAASHYLFQPAGGAGAGGAPPLMVCVSKQGRPRLAPGVVCL